MKIEKKSLTVVLHLKLFLKYIFAFNHPFRLIKLKAYNYNIKSLLRLLLKIFSIEAQKTWNTIVMTHYCYMQSKNPFLFSPS